jgi:hypothetical protein
MSPDTPDFGARRESVFKRNKEPHPGADLLNS